MSTTNSKGPRKETPPKILVLSLLDRQPSTMTLEGTENTSHPIVLDCPSRRRILSESHVKVYDAATEEFIYRKIRYVRSAQSIYVDEQEKANIKPNPLTDVIWIEEGTAVIVRRGADINLYDYLEKAMFNDMAEDRDKDYPAIYTEIRQQEIAKTDLNSLELQSRASSLVLALREAGKKGEGYTYKEDEIEALSMLFSISGAESPEEKMLALHSVAQSNPEFFLNTIADKTKSIRIDIMSAKNFACLDMSKGEASLPQHNKTILKFKAPEKDQDARLDEIVTYFLTPAGRLDYTQMMLDLEKAQQAQA